MSSRDVNHVGPRGDTYDLTRVAQYLGIELDFDNDTDSSPTGTTRDARRVKCRLVANGEASAAILPGMVCTNKTLLSGKHVIIATAATSSVGHGVADHHLPAAGVAAGRAFWLVIDGPTKFINDANATINEFEPLVVSPSVAGSVRLRTAAPADATAGMLQVKGTVGECEVAGAVSTSFYGTFRGPGR